MTSANWNPLVRALHWLGVIALAACVGAVWGHEAFAKTDPLRAQLMQLHFLLGGAIAALTVLRLITRATVSAPRHALPPLIGKLAKLGHLGLYLLLLALPLCGYIAVSGKGMPISLMGFVDVPPLPVAEGIAKGFKEIHEGLANALLALVGLHVAAALYHFVVLKDAVLQSMLGRAEGSSSEL